ncbi:MAG: DinB family protein [Bacteroidota bacterium]
MYIQDIQEAEYDEYTAYYLRLVPKSVEFFEALDASTQRTIQFFKNIPEEKHEYRYEVGKWTPKDVLQHLIDVERIFAYRALRFARKETAHLSGFEPDDYGQMALANRRTMNNLLEEYHITRRSTRLLLQSFDTDMLTSTGVASGLSISVRAIGFKLIGHDSHHCGIVEERYL